MNPNTGEVVNLPQELTDKLRTTEVMTKNGPIKVEQIERDWVKFMLGETITVKGINFTVADVSDQRLVLKFKK